MLECTELFVDFLISSAIPFFVGVFSTACVLLLVYRWSDLFKGGKHE